MDYSPRGRSFKDRVEYVSAISGRSQLETARLFVEREKKAEKKTKRQRTKKKKYISLSICGHCGKKSEDIEKVIQCGFANMLCYECARAFEDDMEDLAKKYLEKEKKE